jgi:large subunit ribosomal protein L15
VDQLNRFADGERISPDLLQKVGLIKDARHEIKLLGDGALAKRLTLLVHQISESAKTQVLEAGGTIELL